MPIQSGSEARSRLGTDGADEAAIPYQRALGSAVDGVEGPESAIG